MSYNRQPRWVQANKTVGFKGVSKCVRPKNCPFRARITVNKKTLHLGYFKTAALAAAAYDEALKEHYGEHPFTNEKIFGGLNGNTAGQ